MTADNLTKALLLNKFKEFIELIRILKIEISSNDEVSNSKTSNREFNNDKISSNIKNNENFIMNYYKKAGKEADEKISFKTKKAE